MRQTIDKELPIKNILILASGCIARHFIEWISKNRVAENQYYVASHCEEIKSHMDERNVTFIDADPTSYSKLKKILSETKFSNLFIVMEEREDVEYVLKNIALVNTKMRIVLVNQWEKSDIGKENENITVVHSAELIAAHLYDQLPNVPLVAQNVGLGRGEIMEVHVPFGSSYAYRHIGSILQNKWKIAALYRDEKQILPTNTTMIRPNDTLLILGKPLVLDGVYKMINKRMGLFPEPFGKNLYLLLDMRRDAKRALDYLLEAMYLTNRLEQKSLFVRVLYPGDFEVIKQLRSYESCNVSISVCYDDDKIADIVTYDIYEYNIGLILNSIQTLESTEIRAMLYRVKKLLYLFGDNPLREVNKCVVLMSENEKMESISSTAFDISETLGLDLTLGDFDPDGDFERKKMIIEHYETLTHIFNTEMQLEQKIANPIRAISKMKSIIQIAPFEDDLSTQNYRKLFSSKIKDFLLTTHKHPKLLVPFAPSEGH